PSSVPTTTAAMPSPSPTPEIGPAINNRPVATISPTPTPAASPAQPKTIDKPNLLGRFFRWLERLVGVGNKPKVLPNQPPTVSLAASTGTVTLPCVSDQHSQSGSCPSTASTTVGLITTASDPDGDTLRYSYTVTGGRT